jgi:hypothetical protein
VALRIPERYGPAGKPIGDYARMVKIDELIKRYASGKANAKGVVDGIPKANRDKAEADMRKFFKTWGYSYNKNVSEFRAEVEADALTEQKDRERGLKTTAAMKTAAKTKGKKPTALNAVYGLLQHYVYMEEHEYVGLALWILHTHVYDRFMQTPRLSLTSADVASGKSNTTKVIRLLALNLGVTLLHPTPADFIRRLHAANHERGVILVDEGEFASLLTDSRARSAIDGGFDKGAVVTIKDDEFNTFCPLILAGVGFRTVQITSRSINIHLFKAPKAIAAKINVLDPEDVKTCVPFEIASGLIYDWASGVKLEPYPEMPDGFQGDRYGDKWRVLISIADSFPPAPGERSWGERAREAAINARDGSVSYGHQTRCLMDCEALFDQQPDRRRIHQQDIAKGLHELDARWTEYRGIRGDQSPHRIRTGEVVELIEMFKIKCAEKWRWPGGKPLWGYHRESFELRWDAERTKPTVPVVLKVIEGGKVEPKRYDYEDLM